MPLRLYASSSSSSLLTLLLLAQVFVAVVVEAGNYSLDVSFPAANQQPFVELPIFAFGETGVTEVSLSDSASPVVVVFVLEKTTSVLTQRVHANIDTQRRLCDVGVGGSSKTNGWRRDLSAVRSPRLSRDNATSASLVVKGAPGFYALTMYRCPGSGEPATTVIPVDVSQYNVHTSSDGIRSVSFASYGDEYVAELYLLMFVLCSIACLVWLRQLRLAAARVAAIHNVMSIVIVVTTVSMQLQWVRLNYIKHDGRDTSVFFEFVCTLMRAVAAVLMFSCVVLLGSGWSIGTPTLRQRERRILVVSAVLQGIVQVATLWSHIPHAVDLTLKAADLVSCILTTVPVAYTVQTLVSSMPYIDVFDDDEEPDEYNKAHGARLREDAARIQRRLTQYRWFHAAIIAYYYASRIVIPLLEGYLDYSMTWVCQALSLLGTFSLYVYCGAKFRPVEVEDVDLTNNNKTPSFGATAMDAVV